MQRQQFTCDDGCGHEVATRERPVIYVVTGTSDNGQMDADVKLPPQIWAILKQAVPRKDFCPGCFAKAFKTTLVTLDQYEASLKGKTRQQRRASARGAEGHQH